MVGETWTVSHLDAKLLGSSVLSSSVAAGASMGARRSRLFGLSAPREYFTGAFSLPRALQQHGRLYLHLDHVLP